MICDVLEFDDWGAQEKHVYYGLLSSNWCLTVYIILSLLLTCGGLGLDIGCALVTGTLWGVVTTPLSPLGKENDDVDETAGDVTPGRTLVLQGYRGVWCTCSNN